MRKVVVAAFVSVDGVMQAPGAPEEDRTGGFTHGGWVAGYFDEVVGGAIGESFSRPYELLLGRKTYDIFAAHWPHITDPKSEDFAIAEQFNRVRKHVATHRPGGPSPRKSSPRGSDPIARLHQLTKEDGPDLLTQGSSELVHALFAHDVVDELRVLTFPIVLGDGKRLFDRGSKPVGLRLESTKTSPSGVVIASYVRAGEVKTGSFARVE